VMTEGGAGGRDTGSIRIIVTSRDDGGNTRGDEVCGGGVDGNCVIIANAHGSNRRATAATSGGSNSVHSRNTVWNADVSSKVNLPCERGAHTLVKEPCLWNARLRQVNFEKTNKVHTRHHLRA